MRSILKNSALDFSSTPVIGGVIYDEISETRMEELEGVNDSDLLAIYRKIGCGSLCRRVNLFSAPAIRPLSIPDFAEEQIGEPSKNLLVGHECDGIDVLATSADRKVLFHLVVWSIQQVYSYASLESALLGLGEVSGLKGLYVHPFHVSPCNFTYRFEVGASFEFALNSVEECVGGVGDISCYLSEHPGQFPQKSAWICDDSRQLLLEVHEAERTIVRLICDRAAPDVGKRFHTKWLNHFEVAGLPAPERAM